MKRINTLNAILSTLLVTAIALPGHVMAEDSTIAHFEMIAIDNEISGRLVAGGDYEKAIDWLKVRYNQHPFANATNLCTAYAMLGQFDEAESHCDDAIALAGDAAESGGIELHRLQRAVAHSNRGVLRMLRGDAIGAETDFRVAVNVKADLAAPTRNLAHVHTGSASPIIASVGR
jgi:Flp pilus assembly protein TadD